MQEPSAPILEGGRRFLDDEVGYFVEYQPLLDDEGGEHQPNNVEEKNTKGGEFEHQQLSQPGSGQGKKYIFLMVLICALVVIGACALILLIDHSEESNNKESVCLWKARNSSYLNGLYSSETGHPKYSLSINDSCNAGNTMYLFESTYSHWTISTSEESTNTTAFKGVCTAKIPQSITSCNGFWQIPLGSPQKDITIFKANHCPQAVCTQITVNYDQYLQYEPCQGIFQQNEKLDVMNLYKSTLSNIYLYFNPSLFRWLCGEIDIIKQECLSLDLVSGYAVEQIWYNLDSFVDGDTVMIEWNSILYNEHNATMSCAAPSVEPTPSPTKPPSVAPSAAPSAEPTLSPTNSACFALHNLHFLSCSLFVVLLF